MPDLGVPHAALSLWLVDEGSAVREGERVVEILTGPAVVDINSPFGGILVRRTALPGDHVLPGQTLGYIEETEEDA